MNEEQNAQNEQIQGDNEELETTSQEEQSFDVINQQINPENKKNKKQKEEEQSEDPLAEIVAEDEANKIVKEAKKKGIEVDKNVVKVKILGDKKEANKQEIIKKNKFIDSVLTKKYKTLYNDNDEIKFSPKKVLSQLSVYSDFSKDVSGGVVTRFERGFLDLVKDDRVIDPILTLEYLKALGHCDNLIIDKEKNIVIK